MNENVLILYILEQTNILPMFEHENLHFMYISLFLNQCCLGKCVCIYIYIKYKIKCV
jgi:hypothetical protein